MILSILTSYSCSTVKNTVIDCPDLPDYYSNARITYKEKQQNRPFYSSYPRSRKSLNHTSLRKKIQANYQLKRSSDIVSSQGTANPVLGYDRSILVDSTKKSFTFPVDNGGLLLTNQSESLQNTKIEIENNGMEQVNDSLVSNAFCSSFDSFTTDTVPVTNESLSSTKEAQNIYKRNANNKSQKNIDPFGLIGILMVPAAIFFVSIPYLSATAGTLAIIFGIISLARINKHPLKYTGKGLGYASIIFGLLFFIIAFLFFKAILMFFIELFFGSFL